EAPVGMPALGEDRALLVRLAPHRDHMAAAGQRRDVGIVAEAAEARRNCLEMVELEALVGKAEHLVLEPGGAHRGGGRVVDGLAEVHPVDVGADVLAARFDADSHCCLLVLSFVVLQRSIGGAGGGCKPGPGDSSSVDATMRSSASPHSASFRSP